MRYFRFFPFYLLTLIIFLGCGENHPATSEKATATASGASTSQAPPENDSIPTYNIIDREAYDAPIKTQIVLHVIISGNITEAAIRNLLNKLYLHTNTAQGFKHHGGEPTHIFIYLYTSREHFNSGSGQWIGMLQKVGDLSPAKISVKNELIAPLKEPPKTVKGLTETKRKEIFNAIIFAERRAHRDVESAYPIPNPARPGYSQAKAKEQINKQVKALDSYLIKYKKEVLTRFNISSEQLEDIGIEGIKKNWPIPN